MLPGQTHRQGMARYQVSFFVPNIGLLQRIHRRDATSLISILALYIDPKALRVL
jgi:hypothetical protein